MLGVPSQARHPEIADFLQKAGIKGRPLRKTGQIWLIAAAQDIKDTCVSLNGKPVVFERILDEVAPHQPIVACAQRPSLRQVASGEDILQTNDPWKQKPSIAPSAILDIGNPQSKQIQQTCRDVKALQTGFQAIQESIQSLQTKATVQERSTEQLRTDLLSMRLSVKRLRISRNRLCCPSKRCSDQTVRTNLPEEGIWRLPKRSWRTSCMVPDRKLADHCWVWTCPGPGVNTIVGNIDCLFGTFITSIDPAGVSREYLLHSILANWNSSLLQWWRSFLQNTSFASHEWGRGRASIYIIRIQLRQTPRGKRGYEQTLGVNSQYFSDQSFNTLLGCRIGEASNPGPGHPLTACQPFNVNFVNVTKLRKHSDEFARAVSGYNDARGDLCR